MKCSLSHAKLRACAARDSSPPLWVAWWHGRYGRARDGGTRGAAVECGTAAMFLQQKQQEDTEKKNQERESRVETLVRKLKLCFVVYLGGVTVSYRLGTSTSMWGLMQL